MAVVEVEPETKNSDRKEKQGLIPGLPDEIAELCLLRLPYPYQSLVRSVSTSWNRAITSSSFLHSKKTLSLYRSYLFIFSFHKLTSKIQWTAFDPADNRWFVLPPMPVPESVCPTSFATASIPRRGKLFVFGGMRSGADDPMRTTLLYCASTNRWTTASPLPRGRSYFAAEYIDERIVTVGGNGTEVAIYDPESDTWRNGVKLEAELARYESAAVGGRMHVTEGWWWPFTLRPRGWVYELEKDTWREMSGGIRDGWTGVSVTVEGKLFMIAEYGDCPVKVFDEVTDTWQIVSGERFPKEIVKRPYAARELDGKIYVASLGLNIAIGSVSWKIGGGVVLTWQVVEAPLGFHEFSPVSCHVLDA